MIILHVNIDKELTLYMIENPYSLKFVFLRDDVWDMFLAFARYWPVDWYHSHFH